MRGRYLFCGASALIVLLLAVSVTWSLLPRSPINQETFDRIDIGMTEEEVVAIIGRSPGNYATGDLVFDDPPGTKDNTNVIFYLVGVKIRKEWGIHSEYWVGDQAIIVVGFDSDRRVTEKSIRRVRLRSESLFQKACRLIGL